MSDVLRFYLAAESALVAICWVYICRRMLQPWLHYALPDSNLHKHYKSIIAEVAVWLGPLMCFGVRQNRQRPIPKLRSQPFINIHHRAPAWFNAQFTPAAGRHSWGTL